MKKSSNILVFLIGIVFLAFLIFGLVWLIKFIVNTTFTVSPDILAPVIAAIIIIPGIFYLKYLEGRRAIRKQIQDQKIPVYEAFLEQVFKSFQASKEGKSLPEQDLQEFFWSFNKKAILWFSDDTLAAYISWKKSITKFYNTPNPSEAQGMEMLLNFEKLLLNFRKDIGHKNTRIKTGDVSAILISDWLSSNTNQQANS